MTVNTADDRLCRAALDGLKTYGRTEFTVRFLERHGLLEDGRPAPKTLQEMWDLIEHWMERHPARCRKLWEYVDELRMWGRQRIFLYKVAPGYLAELAKPAYVRERVGDVYDEPLFQWDAEEPFLARAMHTKAPGTGHPILLLKLIENRTYELFVERRKQTLEDRSTNFFVVDLRSGHAELRVQELPPGAIRNVREEHDRLEAVVGSYLDFERFERLDLTPVMDAMLREPIYTVTASQLKFTEPDGDARATALVAFFNRLFRRPIPMGLNAYRECEQEVVHRRRLHFEINGGIDYLGFGGISDPARVNEIIGRVVELTKRSGDGTLPPPPVPSLPAEGITGRLLVEAEEVPEVRAAVLSAGAIAAAILWMLAEAVGTYFSEEMISKVLGPVPLGLVTVAVEICWIVLWYGWRRVLRGLAGLASLPTRDAVRAIFEARKRRKELISAH